MANFTLSEIPEEEKIKVMLEKDRLVEEAPYHPGYEDASFTTARSEEHTSELQSH